MIVAGMLIQHPGNVLGWVLAGLLAGAIAGRVTRGRGFGCLGDIVIGLVGSFIGGLIVSPFIRGSQVTGFIGTTAVALLGAVILIVALRVLSGSGRRRRKT